MKDWQKRFIGNCFDTGYRVQKCTDTSVTLLLILIKETSYLNGHMTPSRARVLICLFRLNDG